MFSSKGIKEVCAELGFSEEELEPRSMEHFKYPHLPKQMIKLTYERYEIGRRGNSSHFVEKLKLIKTKLQQKMREGKYHTNESDIIQRGSMSMFNSFNGKNSRSPFKPDNFFEHITFRASGTDRAKKSREILERKEE